METMAKSKFFVMVFAVLSLASCSENNAKKTAKHFLQAYYIEHDFDRAGEFSTPATQEHMGEWALLFGLTPREIINEDFYFDRFEITDTDIKKTKAVIDYRVNITNRQLLLSKVNGRWLVDMPTEVSFNNRIFSLSLNKPQTGGFASAESKPTRLGDTPKDEPTK
ncbi:MAG: hypothetical protein FWG79_00365 [Bacteroidales bacterium]|nr:hypothetical protein [Bacteroidales bacterium]